MQFFFFLQKKVLLITMKQKQNESVCRMLLFKLKSEGPTPPTRPHMRDTAG